MNNKQEINLVDTVSDRIVWIDLLRIVATWGVICIHGRSYSPEKEAYLIMGSMFTCCVPCFLMLSGYLMLGKERSLKKILLHSCPKVLGMKLFSLLFSGLIGLTIALINNSELAPNVKMAMEYYGFGTDYLAMLLGCYLVTPFLYEIIKNEHIEKYFIVLGSIFCFIVPMFTDIQYVQMQCPRWLVTFVNWIAYGEVFVPVGAAWYFVVAHYLGKRINKKHVLGSIIMYIICCAMWVGMDWYLIHNPDAQNLISVFRYGKYYGSYVSPIVTLYSISVFCMFKSLFSDVKLPRTLVFVINKLGRCSTIVFLVHGTIISVIPRYLPASFSSYYFVDNIIRITIYYLIGVLVALIVEKTPLFNKIF